MAKIQKTTDYSMFKTTAGNRLVMKTHLANLKRSIQIKNLLHLNPIIVNESWEVIDGQHRLLAAEALNADVYFIQEKGLTLDDVVLLNTTAKQWKLDDYLQSYIARGYKDYIKVRDFAHENGISTSNALAILATGEEEGHISAPYTVFKEGKFEVVNIDFAEKFIEQLRTIAPFTVDRTWTDREFMRALYVIIYRLNADYDSLINKVKLWPKPITRRVGTRDYLRQLEDIYNHKLAKKVRFY